ncbi:egg cell-secreted protein 1.1-like [Tasmannia lanceolata]|uniref:egg cell-secreted protein 1.1-like n=1 Tax=Tasmannia lanceolata TaxID=3420 RepID=UPI0040632FDD
MSKVREVSVFLILVFMATWVAPGLAEIGAKEVTMPWMMPPPVIDPQIQACWSSLYSIEGCVQEIFYAFIKHQFGVGPACCKAINDIAGNCWPKMFLPFSPLFPPFIKGLCMGVAPTPA